LPLDRDGHNVPETVACIVEPALLPALCFSGRKLMSARTRTSARTKGFAALAASAVCALGLAGLTQLPAHAATGSSASETRPFEPGEEGVGTDIHAPKSNKASHVPSKNVPRPATRPVGPNAAKAAEGLSLKDQRNANGGNSFSLEPPDQALCVSSATTESGDSTPPQVIEGVNDVFTVYDKASGQHAPGDVESYDTFFTGHVEVNRTPGATDPYGPFVSDPKCYWDPENHHFYMTILELGTDPATGDFDGTSYEDLAVTKGTTATTDPNQWYHYQLDVANNGGPDTTTGSSGGNVPRHQGCPCLGDQPLIGADANGFFITTNEFSIDGPEFNGAQIYAMNKDALTTGTLKVQRIENDGPTGLPLAEGTAYSVQPATSPTADQWSSDNGGTEYALSALEFTGGFDNRIAQWSLTHTDTLTTDHPAVQLASTVIGSEVYGAPPKVQQKAGPYPQGQSLHDKLNLLDSNDDRMNQVVYSGGKLWSGLNTAVKTDNGPTTVGIAYFVVNAAQATMANQGYVAVNRNSVFFPSIGVGSNGRNPTMVFTLSGTGYYPSVAYQRLTSRGALTGPVTIYAAGTKPADGFTGYPPDGNGVERWGDYSAAVADTDGVVWMAGEYIPGTFGYVPGAPTPPSYIANWGTAIGRVAPTG
jgi:hypothetical protein